MAPRGPAENCFWRRCSLPSLLFGPEERARTKYTQFKSQFCHLVSGRLWANHLPLPAVFPRAAVRLG